MNKICEINDCICKTDQKMCIVFNDNRICIGVCDCHAKIIKESDMTKFRLRNI